MKMKLIDVILKCVVDRDNKHNFIAFILDLMTKINKVGCEHYADQQPSYFLTPRYRVGISHFLTED